MEYDDEAKIVELILTLEDLDINIEMLGGRGIPWSLYCLVLAALAGLVQVAVAVGVPSFTAFDGTAAFVVTAFAVSAALHYYYGERARLENLEKPLKLREREERGAYSGSSYKRMIYRKQSNKDHHIIINWM